MVLLFPHQSDTVYPAGGIFLRNHFSHENNEWMKVIHQRITGNYAKRTNSENRMCLREKLRLR
jgi:hypothetical protein